MTLFYARIPVENHVVKKNNRPIWRGRLGKSAVLRNAEEYLTTMLIREKKLQNVNLPICQYVQAKLTFFFPKKRYYAKSTGAMNRKIPDISNLYQLVEDSMQKAGILFDDHFIDNHDGSRRMPHPDRHYLEIELISID
jgi:Holliday junction resolvase RusA-like endonuclease